MLQFMINSDVILDISLISYTLLPVKCDFNEGDNATKME